MKWFIFTAAVVTIALHGFVWVDCLPSEGVARARIARSADGTVKTDKVANLTVVCNDTAPVTANGTVVRCKSVKEQGVVDGGLSIEDMGQFFVQNKSVITRALVVFGSITAIVLVYISFRFIRQNRQKNKSRKYGLLSMPDDKLELRPLDDDDDDDEDMTVFDRTKPRNVNVRTNGHQGRPLVRRP